MMGGIYIVSFFLFFLLIEGEESFMHGAGDGLYGMGDGSFRGRNEGN